MVQVALFLGTELGRLQVHANQAVALTMQQGLEKAQAIVDGPLPGIGDVELILSVGVRNNAKFFVSSHLSNRLKTKRVEVTVKRGFVDERGEFIAEVRE